MASMSSEERAALLARKNNARLAIARRERCKLFIGLKWSDIDAIEGASAQEAARRQRIAAIRALCETYAVCGF
jgi:hypothetical protein